MGLNPHTLPVRFRQYARGRTARRRPGEMNANETKYERHLQARHFAGEVIWYAFEAVTLKLGPDCRYTVDFIVLLADGMLECHEVKAGKRDRQTGERTFWAEEDAKLKVRVAAGMFPLRFCIVYPTPEGWERKEF